jgi:hypothetical protein
MSAYLCDPEDFAALAQYAKRPRGNFNEFNIFSKKRMGENGDPMNVRDIALALASANLASVSHRYPDQEFGGFLNGPEHLVEFLGQVAVEANKNNAPMTDDAAFQVAAKVEYQSCEMPDWIQQDAYWILAGIKDDAGRQMAETLRTRHG